MKHVVGNLSFEVTGTVVSFKLSGVQFLQVDTNDSSMSPIYPNALFVNAPGSSVPYEFYAAGNSLMDNLEMSGTTGTIKLHVLTETERDALTPAAGMICFNSTAGRFQGYTGAIWVDFN
jgi:hypothetical protein